jgi:hypothetical protein
MQLVPETIGDVVALHINKKYTDRKTACEEMGISKSYLAAVINGFRPPPPQVLEEIGYAIAYVPNEGAKPEGVYVYQQGTR